MTRVTTFNLPIALPVLFAVVLGVALSACSGGSSSGNAVRASEFMRENQGATAGEMAAAGADTAMAAISNDVYRLGGGDQLRLIVFGEEELSGSFEVDATGALSLPLVGAISVQSLTVREAERRVIDGLNQYLINPKVSLEIEEYRPFYIFGEVAQGGEFPYVNNLHVLSAVSMAGGYTPRANRRTVYVTRFGTDEEMRAPADPSTRIEPGDIIRVGERTF